MTDRDQPIVPRESAPDHGPSFWTDLDRAIHAEDRTGTPSLPHTAVMPRVVDSSDNASGSDNESARRQDSVTEELPVVTTAGRRPVWPLAAAAAVLAIVAMSFVALRGNDGATTDLVVASDDPAVVALDGPESGDGSGEPGGEDVSQETAESDAGEKSASTDAESSATDGSDDNAVAGDTAATDDTAPADDVAPVEIERPDINPALGVVGEPLYVPLDGGLPPELYTEGWRFLGNSVLADVSWYAVAQPDAPCPDANYGSIVYVNGSGITQPVRDPQVRFDAAISHFRLNFSERRAAWITSCGPQMQFHVAQLDTDGQILEGRIVWFGQGTSLQSELSWDGDTATLRSQSPASTAQETFAVTVDAETFEVVESGDTLQMRQMLQDVDAPQDARLLFATGSGDALSYWTQSEPDGAEARCEDRGSAELGLWLRSFDSWQPAAGDDVATGRITWASPNPFDDRVAFADVCDGDAGRVFIGEMLADGRIGNVRTIDLAPYIPGFASQLHWVDQDTLRIETDSTQFGVGEIRFDYAIDADGRGVIFQID